MSEAFRKRRKDVDQDLNFGGIFTGLAKLRELQQWVSRLGIDFQQAQDLFPALDAVSNATSTDAKLTAYQTLLREFSQVTTKTLIDDKASEILDKILVEPIRGYVVAMLDKAMAPSVVSEPGLVLGMELPDETLSAELQLQEIDWAALIDLLSKLVALFKSFGSGK